MEVTDSGCIDVAVNNGIPDLLKDKPEGVPVAELAKATSLDAGKLERIMRRLATTHIFREGTYTTSKMNASTDCSVQSPRVSLPTTV